MQRRHAALPARDDGKDASPWTAENEPAAGTLQALHKKKLLGQITAEKFAEDLAALAQATQGERTKELSDPSLGGKPAIPGSPEVMENWHKPLLESDDATARGVGRDLQALYDARIAGGNAAHAAFLEEAEKLGSACGRCRRSEFGIANGSLAQQCRVFQKMVDHPTPEGESNPAQAFRQIVADELYMDAVAVAADLAAGRLPRLREADRHLLEVFDFLSLLDSSRVTFDRPASHRRPVDVSVRLQTLRAQVDASFAAFPAPPEPSARDSAPD